ncbi:MAG: class I SAM-dependent methyltransferase [Actinomycetota bacterium]|nr:class I SAM-dependent methyltransferase [Actinomycetota bacterium]
MSHEKFDLSKLEKLNDVGRFETLSPDAMWAALGSPVDAKSIVEIGAGTGLFAAQFALRAPAATLFAVDIEETMLAWMRDNRPEVASGRMFPVLAEESLVPLPDESADIVYMINLHHELASPAKSYVDALRLLRVGGRFMVVDWAPGDSPRGPSQHIRVAAEDVAKILTSVGFRKVIVHDGVLPYAWLVTASR